MTITRISITLPRDLARAIDARAKELDRSRSWVIAEAARQFLAPVTYSVPIPKVTRVSEPTPVPAAEAVADARRRHLLAEAALPPEERVRRAEELTRLARQAHPRARRQQIIGFDSYEDFYEWKKANRIRP